jgi:hypothetical protein
LQGISLRVPYFALQKARKKSSPLRQTELRSHTQFFYFCYKGVAGIVLPAQVVEQRRSSHWKTLKRNKGTWTK